MATRSTVTDRREKSSRTAADSQPIPRRSPPSEREARQVTHGDADKVVQWLNASKGTASHERVVAIRQELEELPSEFATHADAYVHSFPRHLLHGDPPRERRRDWPKEKLRVQRRLGNRHAALNEALEEYVFHPRATCVILGGRWIFGMVPDESKRWYRMTIGQETISEADAVISLVRLAETGDLQKIRLCEMCKECWRVAAKRNYRFCSDQCREDFYASAPDYHNRKAANQRKYRENLKRKLALQRVIWNGR
jgi:hypothetical protein